MKKSRASCNNKELRVKILVDTSDRKCCSECSKAVCDWKCWHFQILNFGEWKMSFQGINLRSGYMLLLFSPWISFYLNFFFAAIREEARLLCHMSVWILNSGAVFKLVFTADLNNSLIMGGNLPYFSANGAEHIASRNKYLPHTLCLLTRVPK